jgi:O-antigen/teichoic acid export membrane protein
MVETVSGPGQTGGHAHDVGRARSNVSDRPPDAPTEPTGPYRRQVLRNTVATVAANGWTAILTLAAVPLLLSGLGQTAFGLWALLQTFSAVTGWLSLADLGVGLAAVRRVADRSAVDDREGTARTMATALALVGAIGATAGLLLATVGPLVLPALFQVPDELTTTFRWALVAFAAQVFFELVGSVAGYCLDGRQRVDLSRALDAGRRTAAVTVSVILAMAGTGLAWVVLGSAVATATATLAALVILRRDLGSPLGAPDRATGRDLLHYGRRVWLLNSTGVMHRTMDRIIVGIALGPASVALVEIANQVQNGVSAVLGAMTNAVTGSAAWVRGRRDEGHLRELLVRGTKYTCLATVPLTVLVAVLSAPLIEVWVGADYGEAAGLVVLALIYLAVQAPLAAGSNLLVGIGRAGAVLGPAAIAVVVNLAASVVLVQTNGVAGPSVATIVSALVLTPLLARVLARDTGVHLSTLLRASLLPSVIPAAAAGLGAAVGLAVAPGALGQLLVGGALGGVAAVVVTVRFATTAAERSELRGVLPGR